MTSRVHRWQVAVSCENRAVVHIWDELDIFQELVGCCVWVLEERWEKDSSLFSLLCIFGFHTMKINICLPCIGDWWFILWWMGDLFHFTVIYSVDRFRSARALPYHCPFVGSPEMFFAQPYQDLKLFPIWSAILIMLTVEANGFVGMLIVTRRYIYI